MQVFCHRFRVMASEGEPLFLIHNSWARSICIKFAKLRLGFMRCFFRCYKRHALFWDWCNDSMQQQRILSNPIGVGFGETEWLKGTILNNGLSKGMAQSHQQSPSGHNQEKLRVELRTPWWKIHGLEFCFRGNWAAALIEIRALLEASQVYV